MHGGMRLKIDPTLIDDRRVYDILYFSPVEVGDERYSCQVYYDSEIYAHSWPTLKVEKLTKAIEQLKHVELGIQPFDRTFKLHHWESVMSHCKMALAYLDSRDARISMKLCEACLPATTSHADSITQDPEADFGFLRITTLLVLSCAARRIKFYQKAVEALSEAKDICLRGAANGGADQRIGVHPLLTALTMLNLSAVLADVGHDNHGLRWGLEALSLMYSHFVSDTYPELVKAYLLVLACHNCALLNAKLGQWQECIELVNEGVERSKVLGDKDDGLRKKLVAMGAKAKGIPEGFLAEALNAVNGWADERHTWNISFWDFSPAEVEEEIHVLKHTQTLKHLIIGGVDQDDPPENVADDDTLLRLVLAAVTCSPLETLTISGIDFNPKKIWHKLEKKSFLEKGWYYSVTINFNLLREAEGRPEVANYKQLLANVKQFAKKLVLFLLLLGNECEGVNLSENGIDARSIPALVLALRWPARPASTQPVSSVILHSNDLDSDAATELSKIFTPSEGTAAPSVSAIDISHNPRFGDDGFERLVCGIMHFSQFKVLKATSIGLGSAGCRIADQLASTSLEFLCLSDNSIGSDGARALLSAVLKCASLKVLELENCSIDCSAAEDAANLARQHRCLKRINLNKNQLESSGATDFCRGVAESCSIVTVCLAYNNINSEEACEAIADMMRRCGSLRDVELSGNKISMVEGRKKIGTAIEHSRVLQLRVEDMGFDHHSIDDFLNCRAAETQELQVMILSKNPIGDEGLHVICESLSIQLTDLALSSCLLTSESHEELLNLMCLLPNLRRLDLSCNQLGSTGCIDIVDWMSRQPKEKFALRYLELSDNGLGDEGLIRLLPVLSSLSHLGVSKNGITCTGLEALVNANQMIQLITLNLADNSIGERGLSALTERFQQEHKRLVWNPKQLTSFIEMVILSGNPISASLAQSTDIFLKIHNPQGLLSVIW